MKGLGNDCHRLSIQQYEVQDSLRYAHEKDAERDCVLGYELPSSEDEDESGQDKEITPMLPKRGLVAQGLSASCLSREGLYNELTGVNGDKSLTEAVLDGKGSMKLLESNDKNAVDEEKEQFEGRHQCTSSKAGRYTFNDCRRYQSSGLDVIYSESFDNQNSSGNNSEQADDDECSDLVSHSSQPQHNNISALAKTSLPSNRSNLTDILKQSTERKNEFHGITALMPGLSKPILRHRLGSTDNGITFGEGNGPPLRARSFTSPEPPTTMRDCKHPSKRKRSLFSSIDAGWRKWMPGSSTKSRSSQSALNDKEVTSMELKILHGRTPSAPSSPQRAYFLKSSSLDPSLDVPSIGSLQYPSSLDEEDETPVRLRAFSEPERSNAWAVFSYTAFEKEEEADQELWRRPSTSSLDLEMVESAEISRGSYSEVTTDDSNDRSVVIHSDLDNDDDHENEDRLSLGERVTFHVTTNNVSASDNEGSEPTFVSRSRLNTNTENIRMSPLGEDPDRVARRNWILINQRFQIIVFVVSFLFSLLLFAIIVCWVVLISAYVVSIEKVSVLISRMSQT